MRTFSKLLLLVAALAVIATAVSCGKKKEAVKPPETTAPQPGFGDKRVLVVYFSHSGETYTPDGIVMQQEGNTELMARKIVSHLGKGDLFRIETVKPYPTNYQECCDVAKAELESKAMPELQSVVERIDDYDVIFIGYPIWCGTYPRAVASFIDKMSQGLNGRIIIPFSTNEGSDWGESLGDLKAALPGSLFYPGLALRGSKVGESEKQINEWLDQLDKR